MKRIDPSKMGALLKNSLEGSLLYEIVEALNELLAGGFDVMPMLQALPKVARFSTVVMFLDSKEKALVTGLFKHVLASSDDAGATTALAQKFGIKL